MSAPRFNTIEYATECQLCHRTLRSVALRIPTNGSIPKETEEFMRKLLMHVGGHHTAELRQGQELLAQYQSFLVLSIFTSQDPAIQAVFEGMRADIFQRCRRNMPTDEELLTLKAGCNFENEQDARKAYDAMRAVRDLCCELGAAAPKHQDGPQIVLPAR